MVGAGRSTDLESGNGTELYVVTGNAPRQLDRNIALVGRVVKGMELAVRIAARHGTDGVLRETRAVRADHERASRAATCPVAERENLEVMRTDTASFAALVEARRNRRDDFYVVPAGHIDLCNVPLVVRSRP